MSDSQFQLLRAYEPFSGIPDDELRRLSERCVPRTYCRRQTVSPVLGSTPEVLLVDRGVIHRYWPGDGGEELTIEEAHAGEALGLFGLVRDAEAHGVTEALEDGTTVLHIPPAPLRAMILANPSPLVPLARALAASYHTLEVRFISVGGRRVRARMAGYLVERVEQRGLWEIREGSQCLHDCRTSM